MAPKTKTSKGEYRPGTVARGVDASFVAAVLDVLIERFGDRYAVPMDELTGAIKSVQ